MAMQGATCDAALLDIDQSLKPLFRHDFESIEAALAKFVELSKTARGSIEHVFIWDSQAFRRWFLARGYRLYLFDPTDFPDIEACDCCYPASNQREPAIYACRGYSLHGGQYPYAYNAFIHDKYSVSPPLHTIMDSKLLVGYAEDQEGNHVAIKIVKDGSPECEILKMLHARYLQGDGLEPKLTVTIPVLEMLSAGEYYFAVMPRWGPLYATEPFNTVAELFDMVRALLKAVVWLHEHRISHKDLKPMSFLVNLFESDLLVERSRYRTQLKADGKMKYAVFDFSESATFPPGSSLADCRLSYKQASGTSVYFPDDLRQGELTFDPFAWDVCALGMTLADICRLAVPLTPMLAPLFESMTNWDIHRRFTAAEALSFFENQVCSHTTEAQLKLPVPFSSVSNSTRDWWTGLDPSFILKWKSYRAASLPLRAKLLRRLCDYPILCSLVRLCRRFWQHFKSSMSRAFKSK